MFTNGEVVWKLVDSVLGRIAEHFDYEFVRGLVRELKG